MRIDKYFVNNYTFNLINLLTSAFYHKEIENQITIIHL